MQRVSEVMSRDARVVSPRETLQRAAQLMDELDVGALPVCDGERLVGMVTDRDITVRGMAAGRLPQETPVEDVMSNEVRWCFEDQPLDEVMQQMGYSQIRRLPVIAHDDSRRLVGIVSLGDIATRTAGQERPGLERLAEKVSSQSGPIGPTARIGADSGGAAVASGGAGGTGTTGLAGIGTAGGTGSTGTGADGSIETARPTYGSHGSSESGATGSPNDVGPAGDYSR
ncbi:CBS domain-containing protein [Noviherbaspirillum sp. CPCC 100848]|uniref:CBS domain-containing protein n=1 Tax=Noviherbaspirillum album TaxID=3080276 RepID=A0ABU6JFX9_9BURK|nr:CBS domain-containing protein [Noviherbaspirillum sp. CPCC 100848]MEC4722576.1 CBS domain-containing protein [Noviherbaspirillum sp. CPCC 100848]